MATFASLTAWGVWLITWMGASLWTRRTLARASSLRHVAHWALTVAGFALIFHGVTNNGYNHYIGPQARTAEAMGEPLPWVLFVIVVASLAFTWWARIHLGDLWSGTVTRKEGHRIVDTGPYRLVRHPIYTGLIGATLGLAAQEAVPLAWTGAALVALGYWFKARLEEGFLRLELGAQGYDRYRARTPMLIPLVRWRA
jgi:protein-S-isoprenylcysteine O-methyltransferase Ste14